MEKLFKVQKDRDGFLKVSLPYNPQFVEKIKTIKGHRWHPDGKYWSFPNTNGTLERILKVFEGEKVYIDPLLTTSVFESLRGKAEAISSQKMSF